MQLYLAVLLAIVAGSSGSEEKLTEEGFMGVMKQEGSYWLWKRSYNDTVSDGKHKVCVQTSLASGSKSADNVPAASSDTAKTYEFTQSYKLSGCEWFFFTHDASYTVKFSKDTEAGAGLAMSMQPKVKDHGTAVNYRFQFWNQTEKCFLLSKTGNDGEECELQVWNSAAEKDGIFPSCEQAYHNRCGERSTSIPVFTANCRVTASNWQPDPDQDISGCS